MNVQFGALTQASGSIRIANSAYQKWPTKRFPFYVYLRLVLKNSIFATKPILPIKSLRIRPGQKKAPKRLIIRFTRQNWINLKATPAVRRNTSGRTSYYLVRLVFRPYTQIKQTICTLVLLPGLHQFFNWLHHSSGLDHKISGPNGYALTQIGPPRRGIHDRSMLHRSQHVFKVCWYLITPQITNVIIRFHCALK